MRNVAVLDSGIGGLSVLKALDENLSSIRLFYLGDNLNAPYGNRSLHDLWRITLSNLVYLKSFNIDALVLGCNTLSVNYINEIEDFIGVKTFGVFPPIEKAQFFGGESLLLSTVSTAKKFSKTLFFYPLGLPELALDIERKIYSLKNIDLNYHFKDLQKDKKFKTIILGCTHYELIRKEIEEHFCPELLISGVDYTINYLKSYADSSNHQFSKNLNEVVFIGKSGEKNKKIYYEVVK